MIMSGNKLINATGPQDKDESVAIARQVTDTARDALKNIVGQNLLPWPDIYTNVFWHTVHLKGYEDLLLKQHGNIDNTSEMASEFLDKADEILDGVADTVTSFVSGAREHKEVMESTIENIRKLPTSDDEINRELDAMLSSHEELLTKSSEVENILLEKTKIISELQNQLRLDPLTGLLNREALRKDIKKEISRARRYNYPVSVFMADIDHFKNVNDVYGHLVGDSVIKITAKLIEQGVRESDSVYRYGGEEFLALLPHVDAESAEICAERIRDKIANYLFVDKKNDISISLTISIGITEFHDEDDDTSLVARADKALYLAKQSGRNCTRRVDFSD